MLLSAALLGPVVPVATGAASASTSTQPPTCTGTPVFVTASCVDPVLAQPYLDEDQPGTTTDPTTGVTVAYRYVHGGFTGTAARFAFYFPAPDRYRGRFFEETYPTVGDEHATSTCTQVGGGVVGLTPCEIAFAISNGAYVVATNNAGGVPTGGALAPYRANAAAAKYSRVVAEQLVYHTSARPRGYLYGGSGGAYQTVGAMENTDGVWDGAVPMVLGANDAIPSLMSAGALASRVLGNEAGRIADAMAPGGGGDPFAGLSSTQQSVLREVSRLAIPLRSWWQFDTSGNYVSLASIADALVRALDPTYVTDFWTKPGYEGSEPSVAAARVRYDTTVEGVSGSTVVLHGTPAGNVVGADLDVTAGPLTGQSPLIVGVSGNRVQLQTNPGITPGTTVWLDNSWLLALEYYQRHQVPTPDEYGWNQYRGANGQPLEPQRGGTCTTPKGSAACLLVGQVATSATAGSLPDGAFHGKMIMIGSAVDGTSWSADWYRNQVRAAVPNANETFRLWYVDNSDHDPSGPDTYAASLKPADHIVQYNGVWQQALLDLDAWVAHGTRPPASTNYRIDGLDQVQLPAFAALRRGVQPVVRLTVNARHTFRPGAQRIDVAVGQPVTFTVDASMPPGTGDLVKVEWDLAGSGTFTAGAALAHPRPYLRLGAGYTFTRPGTYFPVVRVTSDRNGDPNSSYGLVQNLAGVRVVVHAR